ncbi:MAG: PEGA domain-containing protein [Ignavibacteria bacterium]|nr:PEGA domain-containing protein [Ignavibacteria bacterium]
MNKIILRISCIAFGILYFACTAGMLYAQEDSASVADSSGYISLSVHTNVEQAEVFLDSASIGVAPVDNYKVKKGMYDVKLLNPKRLGDWQNENLIVTVNLNKDTIVYAGFPYYYEFNSIPFDAGVIRNDTLLGKTPLRYMSDYLMKGSVTFRKNNYRDLIYDMNSYDPLSGANVTLKLKDNAKNEPNVIKNKGTQFKTSRNLTLIAGLAASSIAAGYFAYDYKTKANDLYTEYTFTGDKETLDESRQNDTYFAIALVLMQAAIGGLVYFLFFD